MSLTPGAGIFGTMHVEERLRNYFSGQTRFGVVSAYLFGSHGTNRAHRESDIDVGVLLDRERYPSRAARFDVRVLLGSDLIDALDTNDVDVVILNDAPPLLGRRIVIEGRRVFSSDAELDLRYVRDVQLRAADLRPFLDRTAEIKLKALRR